MFIRSLQSLLASILARRTLFSKESFTSELGVKNVTFSWPCELRPKMLTTNGISSFDSSRKSSGDSPANPEWPAKNICPIGASPMSKCRSDLHQMRRCPSIRPNTGVQFQFLAEDKTVDSGRFSLSFRAPCHLDFHSFSRRVCRFACAYGMDRW